MDVGQMKLDDALGRAERHADPAWKEAAREAVRLCCMNYEDFTTDEVWRVLDRTTFATHERRAMGALMRQAVKDGWCAPTDQYRNSERPECHRRPVKVWRSRIRRD